MFDHPQFRRTRGGLGPNPGSEILLNAYSSDTPEKKIELSKVDAAPLGVETSISRADR